MDTPNFYYLPNLVSSDISSTTEPWSVGDHKSRPKGKGARQKWSKHKETKHAFLSLVESKPWNVRVNSEAQAVRVSGFLVDYDGHRPTKVDESVDFEKFRVKPTYWYSTSDTGIRLVFLFETPVFVPNNEFYTSLMKIISRDLALASRFAGFDEKAFLDPCKYYDVGYDWFLVGEEDDRVPDNIATQWMQTASSRIKWDSVDQEVPIDVVVKHLRPKYPDPGFDWDDVENGFRCCRFWDATADAQGTIFRESGIQNYTGEWMPYSHPLLLGPEVVRDLAQDRISTTIQDFAMVDSTFVEWVAGSWRKSNVGGVMTTLAVRHGLDRAPKKGMKISEVEEALNLIKQTRTFQGMGAFLYNDKREVDYDGGLFLNSACHVAAMKPVPGKHYWGKGCEDLCMFLEDFFGDEEKLEKGRFWLAHAYQSAYFQRPSLGLILALIGDPGAGKTFFSKAILGPLLGGVRDAQRFLFEGEKYNDELSRKPVWRVDDPVLEHPGQAQRNKVTSIMKRLVANGTLEVRPMYSTGMEMPLYNRIVITLNPDVRSLDALPSFDESNRDKFLVLKVNKSDVFPPFPSDEELAPQLAHFASYLRDYDIYSDVPENMRFGMPGYIDPSMEEDVDEADPNVLKAEVLLSKFKLAHPGGDLTWEGTTTELFDLLDDESVAFRKCFPSPQALGHFAAHISKSKNALDSYGFAIFKARNNAKRLLSIQLKQYTK